MRMQANRRHITWVELVRLAARDRTDAAIAKPEPPFVRVDDLAANFRECLARLQHGQNRGLAVRIRRLAPAIVPTV